MRTARAVSLASLLASLVMACGGGDTSEDPDLGRYDPGQHDLGPADQGPPAPELRWTEERLAEGDFVGPLRLRVSPQGALWAAALERSGQEESCELAEPPGPAQVYLVRAWGGLQGDEQVTETVAELRGTPGLALGFDEGGAPLVAAQGGTPGEEYCGDSDMMAYVRQGAQRWSEETVQRDSAVPGVRCRGMQEVCNRGDVTGMWPAMGSDDQGRALLSFRDVHYGYTLEDYASSDLELARREGPGSWSVWTVDDSEGAGRGSGLTRVPGGGPALVYSNDRLGQLSWATLGDEGPARQGLVIEGPHTDYAPSVLVEAGGGLGVAVWDSERDTALYVRRSPEGDAWSRELVDADGRGGRWPQLSAGPDGVPWIVYHRCGPLGTSGCPAAEDGARVASRREDGSWVVHALPQDPEAEDGLWPTLAWGADGLLRVLSLKRRYDPVSGEVRGTLILSTRAPVENP